jgi:hypothetical protein
MSSLPLEMMHEGIDDPMDAFPGQFVQDEEGNVFMISPEDAAMMSDSGTLREGAPIIPVTFQRETPKVGPNDPCPCGSGKKYKKCCG